MKSKGKSKVTIRRDAEAAVRRSDRRNRTDEQQLELLEGRGASDCDEAIRLRGRLAQLK